MLRTVCGTLGAFLLCLSGCGYHVAGTSAHLPPGVSTIAVPVFQTKVENYHTEVALTQAVVRELADRTRNRILLTDKPGAGDATLRGTVLSEVYTPLTYNPQTGQSSSYLIAVTASVTLTDRNGRVLYRNSNYVFRQQYQSTADLTSFIQEDSPAVQRLARQFAQTLVSDILDSF